MKKTKFTMLAALLVATSLILAGCGDEEEASADANQTVEEAASVETTSVDSELKTAAPGAKASNKATASQKNGSKTAKKSDFPSDAVFVKDADALIAALDSDTYIVLEPGKYDLTPFLYDESLLGDSEQLFVDNYHESICFCNYTNLTLAGYEGEETLLYTEEAYTDVLYFSYCDNLTLKNLTLGHEVTPGYCIGAVLELDNCFDVTLENMDLYGSGTYGIVTQDVYNLSVTDSIIRECTYGMLDLRSSGNLNFKGCTFKDNTGFDQLSYNMVSATFEDCTFTNNASDYDDEQFIGYSDYSGNFVPGIIVFKGCSFSECETDSIIDIEFNPGNIIFDDKCEFADGMVRKPIVVDSAKELLEAITPGATILLEPGEYNLTDYINEVYEKKGTKWNERHDYIDIAEVFDGLEVILDGLYQVSITGLGDEPTDTSIIVDPRYAAVFTMNNSYNCSFNNLTMGHSELGYCSGNVLNLNGCDHIYVNNSDLFGCGVYGMEVNESENIFTFDSNIHDCESGPFTLYDVDGLVYFVNCSMNGSTGGPYISEPIDADIRFNHCTFGENESYPIISLGETHYSFCEFEEYEPNFIN